MADTVKSVAFVQYVQVDDNYEYCVLPTGETVDTMNFDCHDYADLLEKHGITHVGVRTLVEDGSFKEGGEYEVKRFNAMMLALDMGDYETAYALRDMNYV